MVATQTEAAARVAISSLGRQASAAAAELADALADAQRQLEEVESRKVAAESSAAPTDSRSSAGGALSGAPGSEASEAALLLEQVDALQAAVHEAEAGREAARAEAEAAQAELAALRAKQPEVVSGMAAMAVEAADAGLGARSNSTALVSAAAADALLCVSPAASVDVSADSEQPRGARLAPLPGPKLVIVGTRRRGPPSPAAPGGGAPHLLASCGKWVLAAAVASVVGTASLQSTRGCRLQRHA